MVRAVAAWEGGFLPLPKKEEKKSFVTATALMVVKKEEKTIYDLYHGDENIEQVQTFEY